MVDPAQLIGVLIDDRYCLKHFLGNGAFGFVFAADELVAGHVINEVAVKLIRPITDQQRQDVLLEMQTLARLGSPYLLGYRSAGEVRGTLASGCLFLATELAQGSLQDKLESVPAMTSNEACHAAHDIASALAYLDSRKAVHRDVKPANVLQVGGTWKLADLGLARPFAGSWIKASRTMGTLPYMSPEAIEGEMGSHIDIWAFGILLQQCLGGDFPYRCDSELQFIRDVGAHEPTIMPGLLQPFDSIIRGCLTKDWRVRWTAQQVLDALDLTSTPGARPASAAPTPGPTVLPIAPAPRVVVKTVQLTQQQPLTAGDLHVSAGGGGTHVNITEAIRDAPAGTRIFISPGIYRESIIPDKPIELNGNGPREQIIVEGIEGNCLKLHQNCTVTVRGITLHGRAQSAGKKFYAVSVTGGHLHLQDCTISSDSLSGVAVKGASAAVALSDCHIHNGATDGVLFSEGATGTVESCEISGNRRAGIQIKTGASPIVRECSICHNHASGVVIIEGGKGEIDECDISDNGKAGIQIERDGAPSISRCRIRRNKQQAVSADRTAGGSVKGCDLTENKFGPWHVLSGSLMERRSNKE